MMPPELQAALTVVASAVASGVTSAMANTRAARRQIRKLRRVVLAQGKALKKLQQGQGEQLARVSALEGFQRTAAQRLSWLMGGVHALLGALKVRHAPVDAVAMDAESTGAAVARKAG